MYTLQTKSGKRLYTLGTMPKFDAHLLAIKYGLVAVKVK